MNDCDVAIIGAGHNGLVAAFYLAHAGLDVRLFEARRKPGGACVTEELWPGMLFSTCAHLLHGMPARLHRDLRLAERGLRVHAKESSALLDLEGKYWGSPVRDTPNNLSFGLTAEERAGEKAYAHFRSILGRISARYRRTLPPSIEQLFRDISDAEELDVLNRALRLRSSDIQNEYLPTERLRDRHGSDRAPISRDPSALSFVMDGMAAPDEENGETFPHGFVEGGMGEMGRLIAEAAVEAGARIEFNATVSECIIEDGRVVGIRLKDGSVVRSRLVMSNLDPKATILGLLPTESVPLHLSRRVAELPTDVSSYKFLAVLSELPEYTAWDGDPLERARGGTILAHSRADVSAAYDAVESGRPPQSPVVSISIPSTVDPTLARDGYHAASIWVYPAPSRLAAGPWREKRTETAERLIDQITEYAPNFRNSIEEYRFRTPEDIGRMHGMTDGCIWHVQHEGSALLGNRPLPELSAYRAHLAGLYLCGAGQHPWGEVTGLPGHNAANEVLRDLG